MTCETPCKNCNRKGLPILFTRYAAAYSAQQKGMDALAALKPAHPLQTTPGKVAMKTALYNLRMLRAGYLYVHIERDADRCFADEWKGYVVHPHGYLTEFDLSTPGDAMPLVACSRDAALQANRSMVWVKDAKEVKKLWYMFNPDPVDHKHLFNVIAKDLPKYMQSFDVAGWTGGSTNQKDTVEPNKLDSQVVEFSALSSPALRSACEPLMYGLMGSNAQERGWGDYETQRATPQLDMASGAATGFEEMYTITVKQPDFAIAHGARLRKVAEFLKTGKGAVAACEDAIGIAQELGHLQSEAHTTYAHWQSQQAEGGFAKGVNNEWVLQTVVSAQSLQELVKKGAMARNDAELERLRHRYKQAGNPFSEGDTRREAEQERRDAEFARQQKLAQDAANKAGDAQFARLFDQSSAKTFVDGAHQPAYEKVEALRAAIGEDQGKWLTAEALLAVMGRYSDKDTHVVSVRSSPSLDDGEAACQSDVDDPPQVSVGHAPGGLSR
ncbi:T6SS effector BTH_I2691 family protein, partial [Variovorax robiniae]